TQAIDELKRSLSEGVSSQERATIEAKIHELEAKLSAEGTSAESKVVNDKAAPAEAPPVDAQSVHAQSVHAQVSSPAPKPRHIAPAVLGSIGAAAFASALGTGIAALGANNTLEHKCSGTLCMPSLRDEVTRAKGLSVSTDVLIGVGVV